MTVDNLENSDNFLPKYEPARIAVARARQRVKENNEMISKIKLESNIVDEGDVRSDISTGAENFSYEDAHSFGLYKIKSSGGVRDIIKNIFKVH